MYYPILRGRQNELLAVRELAHSGKLAHVTPVIEPVKTSSTLLTTLEEMERNESAFIVVANPKVGTFVSDLGHDREFAEKYYSLLDSCENLVNAYWVCDDAGFDESDIRPGKAAYFFERGCEDAYEKACRIHAPELTFVNAAIPRMRRRSVGNLITLDDQYTPQPRNADYRKHDDDLLSEEHLYYNDEGYRGFSDYSIIGAEYSESGFMPQVVAIHLTYFDGRGAVRARHFTSGEGFGERDVAGKFSDALEKMVGWASDNDVEKTEGLRDYIDICNGGRFPGLGYAKKLSLKHHMEMMNTYLGSRR